MAQQLNSLLAQSRLPDELVICDDHSSDKTVKEIEKATSLAPFDLKLTVNPRNLGYAQNYGQALAAWVIPAGAIFFGEPGKTGGVFNILGSNRCDLFVR